MSITLKQVSIITGSTETEVYAKEELQKYLELKGVTVEDGGYPITITYDKTLSRNDGFRVSATADGMTIAGGTEHAILYGVYKFLEKFAGVRYFLPGLEKIPAGDITFDEGVLIDFAPIFESRQINWNAVTGSAEWCTKQGINNCDADMSGKFGGKWSYGGLFVHTLGRLTETGEWGGANPCLCDPENLRKAIKNVRAALEANPNTDIVSVSQNDNNNYCKCEKCQAVDAEEGSPSGNMLRFVNAIAADIAEDYPHVVVDTLAYNYTQAAPKITKPLPNVCVRLCSIRCCFMHPLTKCPNKSVWTKTPNLVRDLVEWGKICNRIYIWDYTTNFKFYVPTYANFGALRENMRFYVDNHVRGMFPQGNSQSISGEFGEVRAYLLAKLMWDPYMSEEEYYTHMDEFLEAYYGDGWKYIRKYIDKTTKLAEDGCMNIYENPFTAITREEYAENEADFDEIWQKAEELADEDRKENVRRSALQWQYLKLMLHPSLEGSKKLVHDVKSRNILWLERKYEVEDATDLSLSPDHWFDYRY